MNSKGLNIPEAIEEWRIKPAKQLPFRRAAKSQLGPDPTLCPYCRIEKRTNLPWQRFILLFLAHFGLRARICTGPDEFHVGGRDRRKSTLKPAPYWGEKDPPRGFCVGRPSARKLRIYKWPERPCRVPPPLPFHRSSRSPSSRMPGR